MQTSKVCGNSSITMNDFKYSVVMAIKNGEKFIDEALKSILNQSLSPEKIVIVDDNSQIPIRSILPKNQIIQIVELQGAGQMAALNLGLQLIDSEYVSFLDHDDMWTENRQNRHSQILDNKLLGCVVSRVVNFQSKEDNISRNLQDMGVSRVLGACTFRTSAIKKVGIFNEDIKHHGIIDWWSRAEKLGIKIGIDDQPGLLRRLHANNSGKTSKMDARKSLFEILRALSNEN